MRKVVLSLLMMGMALAPLQATTYYGHAFGNRGDRSIGLGYEVNLSPDFSFVSDVFQASESVWVQKVQISYLCASCSSAVLVDVLANGEQLFTPLIMMGNRVGCVGQAEAPTGGCFSNIQGVNEFMVEKWVSTLQVRIQSAGYGGFEIQLLGLKGQIQYNPYLYAITSRVDKLLVFLGMKR